MYGVDAPVGEGHPLLLTDVTARSLNCNNDEGGRIARGMPEPAAWSPSL